MSDPVVAIPFLGAIPLKYLSMVCLCVQNCGQFLLMRYSRMAGSTGDQYSPGTAVFLTEVVKLLASIILVIAESSSFRSAFGSIKEVVIDDRVGMLKMSVPSLCYTFQNFMLFIAISNLDVTTFQATYQLKILTAGLFTVTMLGRSLSRMQWFSLVCLMAGVALVQLAFASSAEAKSGANALFGLFAILSACVSSGFAGVYFEKILKSSKTSMWLKNIQLSFYGIVIAGIALYQGDKTVAEKGFFFGYTQTTYYVVLVNALGGLLVALVMKYADNILKGFATSAAIILSAIINTLFFGATVTPMLATGIVLVLAAVYLYSLPTETKKDIILPIANSSNENVTLTTKA